MTEPLDSYGEEIVAVCELIADTAVGADPRLKKYPFIRLATDPPAVVVVPGEPFLDYHGSRGGGFGTIGHNFDVIFLASSVSEVAAQKRLYGWLSPHGPVYRALDELPDIDIALAINIGDYQVGEGTLWGGTMRLTYDGDYVISSADPI